jgi:zinc transport system substrate-binding protein
VAALAQAQVYFSIGIPFEARLLQKVLAMNKRLKVVDTREGVKLRPATEPDEDEKDYVKGAPDPHTWLDPMLAKTEAANICKALQQIDPAHATDYERNLKACQDDLDAVDTRIAQALAPLKGRQFMVFHPAFGYFGDRYGLKQVAVELEGKEPSARKLAELIDKARNDGVKVIFVQPQFSRKSAEAVAHAIGGAVVPMDPLAKDYLANLQDMAEKIEKTLK